MQPPIRTQAEAGRGNEQYSQAAGTDTSDLPDLARQEFKQETDINYILSRFGIDQAQPRPPRFGDQDFDLDLHTGYIAMHDSQRAWRVLPDELKNKYPTSAAMLDAMNSGQLAIDMQEIASRPEPARETPAPPA